jgi:hypothetical protein
MDLSSLGTATLSGVSLASILALAALVYKCVNHKEIRSKCCGREATISLDIGDTPRAPTLDNAAVVAIPVSNVANAAPPQKSVVV